MSYNVVGIGEVLWDLLPQGPQLGGAPANFAYHARALGANASVITRVGDDDLGRQILDRFRRMRLPHETVQVDLAHPTGTASVTLNGSGVPHFHLKENVAWDHLAVTPELLQVVQTAHAICFGSLAQRNPAARTAIRRLLTAAPTPALRVFDVNLRDNAYSRDVIEQSLRLANVVKLNIEELATLGQMFALTGPARRQVQALAESFDLKIVAVTSGEKGSLIYAQGNFSEQLPKPTSIVDTVGAGDSFGAAMVMGLLANRALHDIHAFANDLASFVCSQPGATPALPLRFRDEYQSSVGIPTVK